MAIIPLLCFGFCGFFPGIIKHSNPSFSKREGKVGREGGFKIQISIIHAAAYSNLNIHSNIRLVWSTLEKEESKEYKQNGQSAAQKYRSITPNPELNQYITTTLGGYRNLDPHDPSGRLDITSIGCESELFFVLLAELKSKN